MMQCTLTMEAADPEVLKSWSSKRTDRSYLMDNRIIGYTVQFRFIEGIMPSDLVNMATDLFAHIYKELPDDIQDDIRNGNLESLLRHLGVYK